MKSLRLRFDPDGVSFSKTVTIQQSRIDNIERDGTNSEKSAVNQNSGDTRTIQHYSSSPNLNHNRTNSDGRNSIDRTYCIKSLSGNYVPLRIYGIDIEINCPEVSELFRLFTDRSNLTLPTMIIEDHTGILLGSMQSFIVTRLRLLKLNKTIWLKPNTAISFNINDIIPQNRTDIPLSVKEYLLAEIELINNTHNLKPFYYKTYLYYYLAIQGFPLDGLLCPEPFVTTLEDLEDQAVTSYIVGLNYYPLPRLNGIIYKQSFIDWLERYINVVLTLRYIKWSLLKVWNIPDELYLIKIIMGSDELYFNFIGIRSTIQLSNFLDRYGEVKFLVEYINKLYNNRSRSKEHSTMLDIIGYLSNSIN